MTSNEELITTFYQAFQKKDYETMQNCYADKAVFNDEVFKNLNSSQVKAMWEMLIKRGKDLELNFQNIQVHGTQGSVEWIATYTFSPTQRKVINCIKAEFVFENGKIIKHTDSFNFYQWARQALGMKGFILGRTNFLKEKVQHVAMKSLAEYMGKNQPVKK